MLGCVVRSAVPAQLRRLCEPPPAPHTERPTHAASLQPLSTLHSPGAGRVDRYSGHCTSVNTWCCPCLPLWPRSDGRADCQAQLHLGRGWRRQPPRVHPWCVVRSGPSKYIYIPPPNLDTLLDGTAPGRTAPPPASSLEQTDGRTMRASHEVRRRWCSWRTYAMVVQRWRRHRAQAVMVG